MLNHHVTSVVAASATAFIVVMAVFAVVYVIEVVYELRRRGR